MGSGELLNSEGMMFVFLSWICKFRSSISSDVLFATINVKICSLRGRAMLPWQKTQLGSCVHLLPKWSSRVLLAFFSTNVIWCAVSVFDVLGGWKFRSSTLAHWIFDVFFIPSVNVYAGFVKHESTRKPSCCCLLSLHSTKYRNMLSRGTTRAMLNAVIWLCVDCHLKEDKQEWTLISASLPLLFHFLVRVYKTQIVCTGDFFFLSWMMMYRIRTIEIRRNEALFFLYM